MSIYQLVFANHQALHITPHRTNYCHLSIAQQFDKLIIIPRTNTIINKITMVIVILNALITVFAVLCSFNYNTFAYQASIWITIIFIVEFFVLLFEVILHLYYGVFWIYPCCLVSVVISHITCQNAKRAQDFEHHICNLNPYYNCKNNSIENNGKWRDKLFANERFVQTIYSFW